MDLRQILVKRWHYLLLSVLSFASGIIVGYFLSGGTAFSPIGVGIGSGITLAWGIDLLYGILRDKRQEEKEEHDRLMVSLTKHTDELKPSLRELAKEPLASSDASMFLQAKKHIESGYPELWNLLEGRDGIRITSNEISGIETKIPIQIKAIIQKQIPSNLSMSEYDMNCFAVDIRDSIDGGITDGRLNMFKIAESINIASGRERRLLVYMRSDGTPERTYHVENLTEKDKEELAVIMNNILNEIDLRETIEHLHELRRQCNDKHTSFREQMKTIIENTEHAVGEDNRILHGKCKYCEAL